MTGDWNIRGKTVFITGATDGIGKEAALELARRGARIVFSARTNEKGEKARAEIAAAGANEPEYFLCDMSSLSEVKRCAREFLREHNFLHVLINNAGVMPPQKRESKDGIELTMAVNYFAPVLLTELLLPLLRQSAPARVINVASTLHKEGDVNPDTMRGTGPYDIYRAYAASKLALVMYTRRLRESLSGSGVTAAAVHPGWIKTKLALGVLGESSLVARILLPLTRMHSPAYGAEPLVRLATQIKAPSSLYFERNREAEPSPKIKNAALAARLWDSTRGILSPYL
ncbi:hypothetical protein A3A40_03035 [Candidatus Kaiserbacteria bacterium RIFCSPLOWO2_01_FULL_54_20]|uniref:Short-chain dehydrogenase n=1 Tax=Candidatus Kaiserbacteria bacterium RIFCSPLOWO2_01_FULL_54_20 TaxID=1798513 RepID=A0A1F6EJ84_9BACT|nr:MAG: hypothetical protein A3A40_03035 [Candidatus Kaiserbacteria bacterium RIFCSPLOWO2_01_FULL_54_20]